MNISVAQNFSEIPAGRFSADGPYSGQRFREEILVPELVKAQKTNSILDVSLEGVEGLSSSFLEEAFGGLVREESFDKNELRKILKVSAESNVYKPYIRVIWEYIDEAQPK